MKKFLAVLAIFTLVLTACPTDDDGGNGKGNEKTTLTITNLSDFTSLTFSFGDVDFGTLGRGGESTRTVNAETRFFEVVVDYYQSSSHKEFGLISASRFRVNDVFTCEEGKKNQFNFTNTTVVKSIGSSETGIISDFITGIF